MTVYSGYKHFAGLYGSKFKAVGKDESIFQFTDIQAAVDAAAPGDTILIEPGTYTLTSLLSITKPVSLIGMGAPNQTIITSALTTRTVMLQNPATGAASATYNLFQNLKITNSSTGDAIEIDNDGGLAQAMYIHFKDCTITNSSTGVAIDLDQTTDTQNMFLMVEGNMLLHELDECNFGIAKAGSVVALAGMYCTDVFALGTTNVAWIFNMIHCMYKSQAQTTGGSASLITNQVGNIYAASGLGAAVTAGVAGDFDATAAAEFFATYA